MVLIFWANLRRLRSERQETHVYPNNTARSRHETLSARTLSLSHTHFSLRCSDGSHHVPRVRVLHVLIVCCPYCLPQALSTQPALQASAAAHHCGNTCSSHFTLPTALGVPTSVSQHTAQAAHSPPPLLSPTPPGLPFTAPATELKDHTPCALHSTPTLVCPAPPDRAGACPG